MANTTNFGWETPDDTDLVKDGAAAMRTLGNSIDASFVDLKGGTTNQVLAKNSNTDLDFKWVADASGIPATIFDAKGDLIAATGADAADRLAVGSNGQYLQADSTTATGLKWASISAGGMTQIATGSLSGTTTTVSSIAGTYRNLVIRIEDLVTSGNVNVFLRFNSDSASNYRYVSMNSRDGTSNGSGADTGLVFITTLNSTGTDAAATITVFDYANAVAYKPVQFTSLGLSPISSPSITAYTGGGGWVNTSAINSISIIAGSTATLTGTYYIYGVN